MNNSPQTVHFTITNAITLPTITGQPVSKTVVQGADATFSVSAGGTEPLSFQWRWNGQNVAGATNSTLTLSNVQLAQAGDYSVLVRNAVGTTTSSNAVLLVLREPGLVGHWPLDENSGSTASDDSGAGNNGAIHNASWAPGQGGSALSFNGTNSYVVIPNHPSLNFARVITIAAWIQPRATDGLRNIVAHDYSLPPAWAVFLRIQDGQYQAGSWNGLTHAASSPVPSGDLGTWVHLAGVYDGSAWKLYRNGPRTF